MKHVPSALLISLAACVPACAQDLPTIQITKDNTTIDKSCVVEIPDGTVIADADNNGVIHIEASDITVRFAEGSALRGAPEGTPWDTLTGFGIRLEDAKNVTLQNAAVHGFRVGFFATGADGLTIDGGDFSDNYRKKLTSTPTREGGGDWMSPHRNDNNEWLNVYAAAVYVEESDGVTIKNVFIRRGQHGILLDEVDKSKVYDNDASFLTGWGLGLWRSSDNMISRNAFDFCVRGHSEGVYNRGQDSAGILLFEQCNNNVFVENSATHGGDGVFGFAGLEALGTPDAIDPELDVTRVGCNDNVFLRNDLSYAPAHGLEMTFSFGNIIAENRFVDNAICGVWGGFSQETVITRNVFEGNGGMAYGLERGGVNIEHSIDNAIVDNQFTNNRVGVGLWYDDPGQIATLPWGKSNYNKLDGNVIADNRFVIDDVSGPFYRVGQDEKFAAIELRDDGKSGKLEPALLDGNSFEIDDQIGVKLRLLDETKVHDGQWDSSVEVPDVKAMGEKQPVGAREALRGRHMIIMGQWGPWEHEGVFMRPVTQEAGEHVYEVFGLEGDLKVEVDGRATYEITDREQDPPAKVITFKGEPGVHPYTAKLSGGDWSADVSGTLLGIKWSGHFFNWPQDADPREEIEKWQGYAKGEKAVAFTTSVIDFPFGMGGPSNLDLPGLREAQLAPDRYGMIARTKLPMQPGEWKVTTVTDDGIRVSVDGETIIDNWTWHATTTDTGSFTIDEAKEVEIEVQYFELDGGATLSIQLEPVKENAE